MNSNFNDALQYALTKEMTQYDNLNNPYEDYIFSTDFENHIQKIITASEYTYVSIGSRRVRKSLVAILIALFILAATGCAVITHYIVTWNEYQNNSQNTLDVLFEKEKNTNSSGSLSSPQIPDGFKISNEYQDSETIVIEYSNAQNEIIIYSQYNDIENMSVSIDNDTSEFNEISINNYKGYSYTKDNLNIIYWTDDTHFFTLQGTCKMSTLQTMVQSITQQ